MGIYDRNYYRDEPRRGGGGIDNWSAVTTIIAINVAVWIADLFSPRVDPYTHWLGDHLALWPDLLSHPWNAWELITYGFAHDTNSIMHLLVNMFILWLFGRGVESIYGKSEFYRIYLSLIFMSGVGYLVLERFLLRHVPGPLVGASGGVTGIVLIYVCHYPRQIIYYNFFIPMPMWLLGVIYIVGDVTGVLSPADKVAHTAHLTGAAFGYIYFRYHWSLASILPSGAWLKNLTKPKMRVYRGDQPSGDQPTLQQRVDQILAKITREGESSLTDEERRTLEEASRRYRGR